MHGGGETARAPGRTGCPPGLIPTPSTPLPPGAMLTATPHVAAAPRRPECGLRAAHTLRLVLCGAHLCSRPTFLLWSVGHDGHADSWQDTEQSSSSPRAAPSPTVSTPPTTDLERQILLPSPSKADWTRPLGWGSRLRPNPAWPMTLEQHGLGGRRTWGSAETKSVSEVPHFPGPLLHRLCRCW